jgi:hypothetical protein
MTLLQPSGVPSRTAINNAITSEIANHASTTDTNSQHYDSGWVELAPAAGFTATFMQLRRIGKEVRIRGEIKGPSLGNIPAGTNAIIANMPGGFTPSSRSHVWMAAPQNPASAQVRMFANPGGGLQLIHNGTASPYVSLMTTWLID